MLFGKFLIFATERGIVKKSNLTDYKKIKQSGLKAIKIIDGEKTTIDTVINASDLEAFEERISEMEGVSNVNIWIDDEGATHKGMHEMIFISEPSF